MAANTNPIFTKQAHIEWAATGTGANTLYDGTTGGQTAPVLIFTATSEGSYVEKIRVKPLGTNVPTLLHIFINNGSATTTATNNTLFKQLTLPASTSSATASMMEFDVEMNLAIPNGYKLYSTIATAVAAGYQLTTVGGDY